MGWRVDNTVGCRAARAPRQLNVQRAERGNGAEMAGGGTVEAAQAGLPTWQRHHGGLGCIVQPVVQRGNPLQQAHDSLLVSATLQSGIHGREGAARGRLSDLARVCGGQGAGRSQHTMARPSSAIGQCLGTNATAWKVKKGCPPLPLQPLFAPGVMPAQPRRWPQPAWRFVRCMSVGTNSCLAPSLTLTCP